MEDFVGILLKILSFFYKDIWDKIKQLSRHIFSPINDNIFWKYKKKEAM